MTAIGIIMRDGVPLLEISAKQLADVTHIPHGSSLGFALFLKAARLDDLSTLLDVHQTLFFLQKLCLLKTVTLMK